MSTTKLTAPQCAMLATIAAGVVRQNRDRTRWVIDGRLATAAESRVIAALQEKKLVRWASAEVAIVGMIGTKRIMRLVPSGDR